MTKSLRQPVRTCVGCGLSAGQGELVRLRADGGQVVVDLARSGGRGAWLHPDKKCLDRAQKRRSFARALRQDGLTVDRGALEAFWPKGA